MDFVDFSMVFRFFGGILRVSESFQRLPKMSNGFRDFVFFQWLPRVSKGFPGLPKVAEGFRS